MRCVVSCWKNLGVRRYNLVLYISTIGCTVEALKKEWCNVIFCRGRRCSTGSFWLVPISVQTKNCMYSVSFLMNSPLSFIAPPTSESLVAIPVYAGVTMVSCISEVLVIASLNNQQCFKFWDNGVFTGTSMVWRGLDVGPWPVNKKALLSLISRKWSMGGNKPSNSECRKLRVMLIL